VTQAERAEVFRALHEGEPFVFPNPWDAESAQALAGLGFKALASTSGGYAERLGKEDGEVTLDESVEHARELSEATDLPVAMDLENGYGAEPAQVARTITRIAEAGAVGGSIEDWDVEDEAIYPLAQAVERIEAAVEAARALDFPFTLTARAENQFRRVGDLADTIARLRAYEAVGADVLYAPRLRNGDEIRAVCEAVSKPVNVLAMPGMQFDDMVAAGGQRISIGAQLWTLSRAVGFDGAMEAAATIRDTGDFSVLPARR
jgi:2-methylisocitrate lyase-like PEP mutase family enzyme